jgi:D-alanyl-lipoteichoic acid acyltransferase DltB (MBOAT superfamily)
LSFISASFVILYLLVFCIRWSASRNAGFRIVSILAFSWLFYAWNVPNYFFLLLFSTITVFVAGRWLGALETVDSAVEDSVREKTGLRRKKKSIVIASVTLPLGMLIWFKYADFLVVSLNGVAAGLASQGGWSFAGLAVPEILLPIGISFYTFQAISYPIDIYRGTIRPERSFLRLACYVAFFPQLVAGPIVRAGSFIYQLDRRRRFHWGAFFEGGYLIIRGLFFKLVVADNIGRIVDEFWVRSASVPDGTLAFSMLFFFACQLLCDFAAYSDIARGLAYQLGFRLPVNFNAPYIAASFSEFWHRWHITLSQWVRDYIYVPLGGSRGPAIRVGANLLLAMMLSGLWHGGNWTFVAWGCILGLALVIERSLGLNRKRAPVISVAWFVFVQVVWVFSLSFFRSDSLAQAASIIGHAALFLPQLLEHGMDRNAGDGLIVLGWWLSLPVWLLHGRVALAERTKLGHPRKLERSIYAGLMLASTFMMYSSAQQFIYYQF